MILLNDIVEVFDLTQFGPNRDRVIVLEVADCGRVSRILIDIDHPRRNGMLGAQHFEKEPPRSLPRLALSKKSSV